MKKTRHKCCICWSVRYKENMTNVFSYTYACTDSKRFRKNPPCKDNKEIFIAKKITELKRELKKLSSYV